MFSKKLLKKILSTSLFHYKITNCKMIINHDTINNIKNDKYMQDNFKITGCMQFLYK